jgi:hypothetical protein
VDTAVGMIEEIMGEVLGPRSKVQGGTLTNS